MAHLSEEAARELVGEIVRGELAEGDELRELDIAERFGVSRPIAREAARWLRDRGLVDIRHGRPARVLPQERWNRLDPVVLAALMASDHAPAILSEFLECRRILEVEAAGLAAERANDVRVASIEAAFEHMRRRAEAAGKDRSLEPKYQEADIAFHRAILLAAGNPALAELTEPIHRALSSTVSALARPEDRFERGLPEHERIVAAIAAGDPAAAREAMRAHLVTVEEYLSDYAA